MSAGLLGTKLINDANAQVTAEFTAHEFPVGGDVQSDFKNVNKLKNASADSGMQGRRYVMIVLRRSSRSLQPWLATKIVKSIV